MAARCGDPEPERVRDALRVVQTGGDLDRQGPPGEFEIFITIQWKAVTVTLSEM